MSQRFKEAEILSFAHGYCCFPALELQFGKKITGTLAFLQTQNASITTEIIISLAGKKSSARFVTSAWRLSVFILLNKTIREQN